jgi:AcrR family transcriptional regulator
VTVPQIAERAGLTRRTFSNYFPDKHEVLFAGAPAFQAAVVAHAEQADVGLAPIDIAADALTRAGAGLAEYGEGARHRRRLIVSSPELQERELIKMATLTTAIAEALARRRDVPRRHASLAAKAAVTAFDTGYDDWLDDPETDLATLVDRALTDLRRALEDPQRSSS